MNQKTFFGFECKYDSITFLTQGTDDVIIFFMQGI